MSATSKAAPTPTPTPMPIFVPLDILESAELFCEGVPVREGPSVVAPEAGVAVGVKSTPIFCASDVAYATGNKERSFASQATYSGSAIAVPRVMVVMFETVDWSLMICS
jgi:hypothetical protein